MGTTKVHGLQTFNSPFTGSFSGSHTGTFPYNSLVNIPSAIVSSSSQVINNIAGQTINPNILSASQTSVITSSNTILSVSNDSQLKGMVGLGQILYNPQTILSSCYIPSYSNAMSVGPIELNTGVTVTIESSSLWNIL